MEKITSFCIDHDILEKECIYQESMVILLPMTLEW